jgi:threonine synthase
MRTLGFIHRVPRLLGVQAEGACAVFRSFSSGSDLVPSDANTIADSIAVGTPRNWRRAIQQIKQSNGTMMSVSDQEILEAMRVTARLGGVFGEPAGVAGVAGLKDAITSGVIKRSESVVVVITGNGLKDIQSAKQAVGKALDIEPDFHILEKRLKELSIIS